MNRQIAHLKAAVTDLVAGIQKIRQRRELDDEAAALYRTARANGLQKSIAKEVIREIGEAASAEIVWQRYATKAGIVIDEKTTDDVSALDAILDHEFASRR